MKRVLTFQVFIGILGSVFLLLRGTYHEVWSYSAGALIVTGNFILLGSGWNLVFRKKLIALSALVIVFKYAILGIIIYIVAKQSWLQPIWFAAGVASMMMASLIYGLTLNLFEPKDELKEE